ncbi:MAG: tyrosine-type recombinase/integrase [Hydrogenophaga sp.]|uniref:tyrosine-type recombinase/integrase n=1 Tax=Hydrogenophaga sp. TaxID=1904254 RepID=UPI004035F5DE
MASIENRSRFKVAVQNRDDLTLTFTHSAVKAVKSYVEELKSQGFKPKVSRLNDSFAVRVRQVGYPDQTLFAASEDEAVEIQQRIESERRQGLFVDYGKARRFSFGDLLARYLREESPRHKGFGVEGYIINAILEDAGLPRVDTAAAYAAHKNPHPSLASKKFRKPTGKKMREASVTSRFILKSFAELEPTDFNDYIDDRCQSVAASTVDREVDIFSAACRIAIDTWRIPVAQSPMAGVKRPSYFNERDRRLKGDEEQRLLDAAHAEDARQSIAVRLEELMGSERAASQDAATTYRRKAIINAARAAYASEAEATYVHVPLFETFVNFQLMTGARRSEALSMTWDRIDLDNQTAFIPESKNGRPRKLPLRKDLIELLKHLPRTGTLVFPFSLDALRKAWARICEAVGLVGADDLHIHDLRHEAISRVADAGAKLPGGFSLVDLQAFSGHRDTRMLLRYTHLCTLSLAKRLDEAFADQQQVSLHRGQRRLKQGASLTMKQVVNAPSNAEQTAVVADVRQDDNALPDLSPNNVVPFRPRRAA